MSKGNCLLLTGPNMAGKSTIMRQVACIALLTQIGSFIPASDGDMPVFDQIFTRIGASDFLNEGLSTFMVEMKEAAYIARQCSENSLVILDEIGRGTSTYDGMSLAQSILEYLVTHKGCITFFATHYHELTSLENKFTQIKNVHMSIKDKAGDISFLHTLVPGPANRSYGIHVAKLAGVPAEITRRAAQLLKGHESFSSAGSSQLSFLDSQPEVLQAPEHEMNTEMQDLLDQIKATSIQSMTPIDALNTIVSWQQKLS